MYYEDFSRRNIDVAYYKPSKTPAQWAEVFGRKAINSAMDGNTPLAEIEEYARMAGSFARIALEQAEEPEPDPMHPLMREHLNLVKAVYGVPGGGL